MSPTQNRLPARAFGSMREPMAVRVFQYPNCGSCKKALSWLDDHDVAYQSIHIVESTPTKSTLAKLWKKSGLPIKKFFNTSGKAYREGGFSARLPNMSEDDALEALASDGMLIKRPLLESDDTVLVGFKANDYESSLT